MARPIENARNAIEARSAFVDAREQPVNSVDDALLLGQRRNRDLEPRQALLGEMLDCRSRERVLEGSSFRILPKAVHDVLRDHFPMTAKTMEGLLIDESVGASTPYGAPSRLTAFANE